MDGGTAEGIVDEEQLSELLDLLADDPGLDGGLAHALDLFLTSVPTRLADLAGAVATGGLGEAATIAHSVRGSAGAFGARRMASLTAEVERRCADPGADPARLSTLVASLEAEFAAFRRALESRVAGFLNAGDAETAVETEDGGR